MSLSEGRLSDDHHLIRYLLGSLAEAETERLDELSIADDEWATRLSAVENDLVDAFVRGELSGETLEQFQSHYLSVPANQEKVRFAETLLAYQKRATGLARGAAGVTRGGAALVQRASVPAESPPASEGAAASAKEVASAQPARRSNVLTSSRRVPLWALAAAAAALLVLATGAYLVAQNTRLRHEVSVLRAARTDLEQHEQLLENQFNQQRAATAQLEKELAGVRQSLARLEAPASPDQRDGKALIASFLLMPALRGSSDVSMVVLPPGTTDVRLQLQLESNDYRSYRVTLKEPASARVLWRSAQLRPGIVGGNKLVSVTMPAALFKPRNYSIELAGVRTPGPDDFIASYAFKVLLE